MMLSKLTAAVRARDGGAGLLAAREEHTRRSRHMLLTKLKLRSSHYRRPCPARNCTVRDCSTVLDAAEVSSTK